MVLREWPMTRTGKPMFVWSYETPAALRAGLAAYFQFYNGRRRHSALWSPNAGCGVLRRDRRRRRGLKHCRRFHLGRCPDFGVQFCLRRAGLDAA